MTRPTPAVAAGDAICWSGAPLSLLDAWSDGPHWDQPLLRAVIYRVATRAGPRSSTWRRPTSEQYVERLRPSLHAVLGGLR
ncbi:MAG: hypothetical protein ABJA74_16365 [Lapillicoccus sp.]